MRAAIPSATPWGSRGRKASNESESEATFKARFEVRFIDPFDPSPDPFHATIATGSGRPWGRAEAWTGCRSSGLTSGFRGMSRSTLGVAVGVGKVGVGVAVDVGVTVGVNVCVGVAVGVAVNV
jgi:hypothetical protein